MATIQEYIDAVGALGSENKVITAYKEYVTGRMTAAGELPTKKAAIQDYETWKSKGAGKKAYDANLEDGVPADAEMAKLAAKKVGVFNDKGEAEYESKSSWLGSNWMGLTAAAGAFILAKDFLGTLGALAVAAVGMLAVGAFTNEESWGAQAWKTIRSKTGRDDPNPEKSPPALTLSRDAGTVEAGKSGDVKVYVNSSTNEVDELRVRKPENDTFQTVPLPNSGIKVTFNRDGKATLDEANQAKLTEAVKQAVITVDKTPHTARDGVRMKLDTALDKATENLPVSVVYDTEIKAKDRDGLEHSYKAVMVGTYEQAKGKDGKLLENEDGTPKLEPVFKQVALVDEKNRPLTVKQPDGSFREVKVTADQIPQLGADGKKINEWRMSPKADGTVVVEQPEWQKQVNAALAHRAQDHVEQVRVTTGKAIESAPENSNIKILNNDKNKGRNVVLVFTVKGSESTLDTADDGARNLVAEVTKKDDKTYNKDLVIKGVELYLFPGSAARNMDFNGGTTVTVTDVVNETTGEVDAVKLAGKATELRDAMKKLREKATEGGVFPPKDKVVVPPLPAKAAAPAAGPTP